MWNNGSELLFTSRGTLKTVVQGISESHLEFGLEKGLGWLFFKLTKACTGNALNNSEDFRLRHSQDRKILEEGAKLSKLQVRRGQCADMDRCTCGVGGTSWCILADYAKLYPHLVLGLSQMMNWVTSPACGGTFRTERSHQCTGPGEDCGQEKNVEFL